MKPPPRPFSCRVRETEVQTEVQLHDLLKDLVPFMGVVILTRGGDANGERQGQYRSDGNQFGEARYVAQALPEFLGCEYINAVTNILPDAQGQAKQRDE
jgi:hypothetical protein